MDDGALGLSNFELLDLVVIDTFPFAVKQERIQHPEFQSSFERFSLRPLSPRYHH